MGEASCLLQPEPPSASSRSAHTKSKLASGGFGAPTTTQLLGVRDLTGFEMPPSYESACGRVLERSDSAVCTITGASPSAVAYCSYPVPLRGIPDAGEPVYQNQPDWRFPADEYGLQSRAAKRGLPMSPTHVQALQQCAIQQRHQHQVNPDLAVWPVASHRQYPTPPSQHSHSGYDVGAVPMAGACVPTGYHHPEQFLTPSPDSPGQWSSSSPHSGQSDWSEGISSPPQTAPFQHQGGPTNQRLAQGNAGKDCVFLVRT